MSILLPAITLVTVTYGDRIHFLLELLTRALDDEGVSKAVVVNNGSRSDLSPLKLRWKSSLTIVELGANIGSAAGYAAGIEAALKLGDEFLWLMDDDNAPAIGSTQILARELMRLREDVGGANAAVVGFRADRFGHLRKGQVTFPLKSSFMGFHFFELPSKIRRLRCVSTASIILGSTIDVPYSSYGGLMAGRDVFKWLGLPRQEFVLYADDWEYTYRFTTAGGTIKVVSIACIDDLEKSWFQCKQAGNIFIRSLISGDDVRVYYTYRNHVWISKNMWCNNLLIYRINKWIFIFILLCCAIAFGRMSRFSVIRKAIDDGECGKLGLNPEFRLY